MYHGVVLFNALPVVPSRSILRPSPIISHTKSFFHRRYNMASNHVAARNSPLKKRSIAGSFLFKLPSGDEKQAQVALFRRSGKVRTYQHKLAPISGSVEKDDTGPLATALREINEETGLTLSSLELLRIGKPYSFVDESIGREWTINPFAFRLKGKAEGGKGEEGIAIDWEHEGYEWFNPLDINESDEFGGVPKLVNSLRRVWPECDLGLKAGRTFTSGLQQLRDDHESGARQLATLAVSTLKNLIVEMESDVIDKVWFANIRMAAWHICKARESMGSAITSAVVQTLRRVEATFSQDLLPSEKLRRMVKDIENQLDQRKSTTDRIRDTFVDYLRQNVTQGEGPSKRLLVLTLSSSSTVSACLLRAATDLGVSLDLRILESRPLYEGVTLASKLLETKNEFANSTVSIYTDASMALATEAIDIIVLGADRISSAGDVSNKIGSLPLVLSQRYVTPHARVVILSETEKIAGLGLMAEHTKEENSCEELVRSWNGVQGGNVVEGALRDAETISTKKKVYVKNAYFEWVPARFIHAYVTDEGLWSVDDITKRSNWIGNEMDRFFKDL